jgi:molecular chaperone GrpE
MGRRISIPVRVLRPTDNQDALFEDETGARPVREPSSRPSELDDRPQVESGRVVAETADVSPFTPAVDVMTSAPDPQAEAQEWRDRALRLQAEMDNFRKRQQRWAQDQIEAERHRLLNAFLQVVDDLERALVAPAADDVPSNNGQGLRRGVELTHRSAMQLLQKEGVETIEAEYQPFDPNWHEAVATTGHHGSGLPTGTAIQVLEPGYRLDGRLLRPAKVIVAV